MPNLLAVRILDKYLVREFVLPLLYCFDAFMMMWIVVDLFGSLDDFIDHHARVSQVLQYYVLKFPDAFTQILPMSLLLGLLFCLTNLGKHNELIAMRASGVSLARLACPLLGIGAAATILVFAVNELFGPRAFVRAEGLMNALKGKAQEGVVDNFFFTQETGRRDWYARKFDTRIDEMERPEIHDRKPDGTPEVDVYAERARWVDGGWRFYGVEVYDHRQPRSVVLRVAETNFPSIKESPRRLEVAGKKPDQMTSAELRRTIRTLNRSGRTTHLAQYQVALQYRYAFPFTCLIVVWIGIPLGMRVSRSGPLLGVGTALLLVVVFYFATHITMAMGSGGRIPAVAAAWLTNGVFAVVGAVLLWRVR